MTEHDDTCDSTGLLDDDTECPGCTERDPPDADDLAEQLAEARRTIEAQGTSYVEALEVAAGIADERDKALADLAATRGTLRARVAALEGKRDAALEQARAFIRHHNVQLTATRDEANGYHAERDAAWEARKLDIAWFRKPQHVDDVFAGENVAQLLENNDVADVDTYGIAKLERDLQAERDAHAGTRQAAEAGGEELLKQLESERDAHAETRRQEQLAAEGWESALNQVAALAASHARTRQAAEAGGEELLKQLESERDAHAETRREAGSFLEVAEGYSDMLGSTSDRLDDEVQLTNALKAERDALAASLERVREALGRVLDEGDPCEPTEKGAPYCVHGGLIDTCFVASARQTLDVTADPAAVLRERDARVWDEGTKAGWSNCLSFPERVAGKEDSRPIGNPHREEP